MIKQYERTDKVLAIKCTHATEIKCHEFVTQNSGRLTGEYSYTEYGDYVVLSLDKLEIMSAETFECFYKEVE